MDYSLQGIKKLFFNLWFCGLNFHKFIPDNALRTLSAAAEAIIIHKFIPCVVSLLKELAKLTFEVF